MHFRDPQNRLHFLSSDDIKAGGAALLPAGSAQIADAEADATRRSTPDQIVAGYTAAIQTHLDNVAQAWGYDSVYTAATYADEPAAPEFQREGRALRAWRSRVWAAARQTLADVQDGKTPLPTVVDLIASLPAAPTKG